MCLCLGLHVFALVSRSVCVLSCACACLVVRWCRVPGALCRVSRVAWLLVLFYLLRTILSLNMPDVVTTSAVPKERVRLVGSLGGGSVPW